MNTTRRTRPPLCAWRVGPIAVTHRAAPHLLFLLGSDYARPFRRNISMNVEDWSWTENGKRETNKRFGWYSVPAVSFTREVPRKKKTNRHKPVYNAYTLEISVGLYSRIFCNEFSILTEPVPSKWKARHKMSADIRIIFTVYIACVAYRSLSLTATEALLYCV